MPFVSCIFLPKSYEDNIFSFDGNLYKAEASSNYQHKQVNVLGIYKEQPFTTGSNSGNKKTEIFNYDSKRWIVAADYPFTSTNR